MDVQTIIERSLDEFKIRELYLYKIPVLKTCDNWSGVKEIGAVDFQGKHANYKGALVKYADKIYFVSDARIDALAAYRKWDLRAKITVIPESEVKKKK